MNQIVPNEQYGYLVEHCKAIIIERVKSSREQLILAYAEIGEMVCKDSLYRKSGKGNRGFLEKLGQDIGIGERNLYYAIQFYEKYLVKCVDVCMGVQSLVGKEFVEGDNISWN